MKLDVKAFAVTCGLVWGLGLFCLTWWIILWEGNNVPSVFLSALYRGYTISPVGSVIGLIWAFLDGWVGGLIFAWLYNKLAAATVKESGKSE